MGNPPAPFCARISKKRVHPTWCFEIWFAPVGNALLRSPWRLCRLRGAACPLRADRSIVQASAIMEPPSAVPMKNPSKTPGTRSISGTRRIYFIPNKAAGRSKPLQKLLDPLTMLRKTRQQLRCSRGHQIGASGIVKHPDVVVIVTDGEDLLPRDAQKLSQPP